MGAQERIKELEDEMRKTQYNKATEHHFGVIKARIAKLKEDIEKTAAKKGGGKGFHVKKSGDGSVVLLGFPSVGKSTLLNALTSSKSKIGEYAFTTLDVVPGVLKHKYSKIQILDIPGIISGAASGKGRGKEILSMVRSCDLILILIDALHPEHHEAIKKEIWDTGIRMNQRKPDVKVTKKDRGGIDIGTTVKLTKITKKTIKAVMKEWKLSNADVVIRNNINVDQMIDVLEGNRKYIPSITIVSKIDLINERRINKIKKEIKPDLMISATNKKNIEDLKDIIFNALNFIRVFLKEVGKKPDLDEPMIVIKGSTIRTICQKLHRDFVTKFRFAKIWGKGAKFPGQSFQKLDKKLIDGDILEIHLT